MASDKVLKFQVAIQDNATKGLEEIEKKFLGLSNQAVTVVGNINNELKKIGGVSFNMPDLAKTIGQLNSLQDSISKKNVGDIPIFKNTLEQMQQLQNFIGKNTLGREMEQVKRSINGVFAEIPNVSASSFTSYFNQLNKAYNDFLSKMGNNRTLPKDVSDIGGRISAMGGLAGNNSLLREYQAQAEQIKATILNTINEVRNSIEATKTLLSSKALDFGKISTNIDNTAESLNKLSEAFTRFNGTIGGDKNMLNMMTGMGEIIRNVKFSMNQLEEGNKSLQLSKSMQDFAKSINDAQVQMVKLEEIHDRLARTAGKGLDKLGVDATSAIRQRQVEMTSIFTNLQQIASNGGVHPVTGLTTSQYMGSAEVQIALIRAKREEADVRKKVEEVIKQEEQAEKQNGAAKQQAIGITAKLSQEENRLSQAIQQTTNSAHGQSQVLSDLKSMAFQYLSIYGVQNFVTQMAQITGELQLQAKSLEVILNNASAAKQMYGEIRDLSQMSPYTFEDLLKSHRQLAAFGIEPKDMFPTMKSLADIGAGLDVDISRLILAFGHTRSYGYLSGIQNRQFENAGIDMIGGLAAKYNELADAEKRAGREANYVTRADIFKRMRARGIPFEDVQDVVLDLDRPGGKFYNMQIRQFETLGGKLRNLRNNYRIMMSELGNSNQGFLMGSVNIINNLTEHWEKYARVIKGVALAYASLKLAGLASNKAVMAANKEIMASSVARNSMEGTTAYLNGSKGMWGAMGSSRKFFQGRLRGLRWFGTDKASAANDGEVLNLAANKEINNLTKQRIALSGRLTAAQRELLLVESGIGKARAAQIAGFSAWRRGLLSVRLSMIAVAQSAKAMAVALLSNPMTWLFAAVAAVTALADKLGQTSEQAENLKNSINDAAQTDIQGLNQLLEPYEKNGVLNIKGKSSTSRNGETAVKKHVDINVPELMAHGIDAVFDELKRALQVQSPFYEGDYFDVLKAGDQAKQVEAIFRKLENISYVKQVELTSADQIEKGYKDTGANWNPFTWWRGESFGTNMKDFAEAQAEYANNFRITEDTWNKVSAEDKAAINKYIEDLGMSRDEAVRKYMHDNPDKVSGLPSKISAYQHSYESATKKQLEEATKDMPNVADSFVATFKDRFSGDMEGAMTFFDDVMNKMYAEHGIGSPEAQAALSENMVTTVVESMKKMGLRDANAFLQKFIERQVGAHVIKDVETKVNRNTSDKDARKIIDKSSKAWLNALLAGNEELRKKWEKLSTEMKNTTVRNITEAGKKLAEETRRVKNWQDEARKAGLSVDFNTEQDYTEFIQKQRKAIKDAQEILDANEKKLKFELGVNIDLKIDSIADAKKLKDAINKQLQYLFTVANNFKKAVIKKYGKLTPQAQEQIQGFESRYLFLKNMRDTPVQDISRSGSYLDDQHQSWEDSKKNKGKGNGKNKKDVYAESLRREIHALSDAYNVYRQWEKKIGSGGALKKIKEQFFGKDSLLKKQGYSFEDIPNYLEALDKLNEKVIKHYGTKKANKEVVAALQEEIKKAGLQVKSDNFDDATERWASKVSLYLDRLTKKWELYNKVITATGNAQLAMSLSGFNIEKYQNVADALKDEIELGLKGLGIKTPYTFDVNESDESIEKSVQKMLGETADAEKIKSISNEIKKWRDLQQEIDKEAIETYASLKGGLVDFGTELDKINSEYNETLRKLNNGLKSGKLSQTQYNNGESVARAKRDAKVLENSAGYKNFFASVWAQSIRSAMEMAEIIKEDLTEQFRHGIISAKDYSKKIEEVNTQMQKINDRKSDVAAFMGGGLQGLFQNKYDSARGQYMQASNMFDSAKSIGDSKLMKMGASQMSKAGGMMKGAQGAMSTVAIIDKIVNGINDAVQQLKGILDDLANTLDYVNGKGDKLRDSNGYGFMSAFSQASQGAADGWNSLKNGDVMGTARGVIKSWTGWYTGFAQHHDNKLERQIVKLRENVSKIEGYTEIIAKAQDRTLGYDNGDLIRSYQKQYAANNLQTTMFGDTFTFNKEGNAGKAMQDYYNSAGGGDINGYQQQYNLLVQKRKDYVDMYNKEDGKKKKSNSALNESKQKIAELDDQLRFFSEDLAKRLWGLDVKGWADQLSDALVSAFENGENMAKAYGDTVRNILQSLGSKMIQLQIMEPMFEKLRTKLFGDGKDNKGVFDPNDVARSAQKVTDIVADFFGQNGDGKNAIVAAQEALAAYEKGLNDAGLSVKNNSNSTLSSGIQGTSEETSALLAGYINALRQDVSVIRIMQTQFINDAWPDYIKQITGMAATLGRIDANVAAIRAVISENGALYNKVERLSDDIHNVIYGSQRLHVN